MKLSYYNKISKIYDIIYKDLDYNLQTNWVNNYVPKNKLKKKVLDIACGTGKNLLSFEKLGYETHGVDVSKGMLKEAKKRLEKTNLKLGSFKKLNIKDKFPLVTCFFNSLSYNKNNSEIKNVLKNIYNILDKNGLFVFDLYLTDKPEKAVGIKEYKQDNKFITRTFIGVPKNNEFHSTMIYVYFDGNKTETIKEETVRGIFSLNDIETIIKGIGFKTVYKGEGYWKNTGSGITVFVLKK